MKIIVAPKEQFAAKAAEIFVNTLKTGGANICLPTGDTPKGMYQELVKMYNEGKAVFKNLQAFVLDEWGDIPKEHPARCINMLRDEFFEPIKLNVNQIFHYDNFEEISAKEKCLRYENELKIHGGLHLSILGIGMNGHVGFNEPGSHKNDRTKVVELASKTVEVSKKYGILEPVSWGMTIGIGTLLESKSILIIANGAHKKEVVQKLIEGNEDETFPISLLKNHQDVTLLVDQEAYM